MGIITAMLALPVLFLAAGALLAGSSVLVSLKRRRVRRGWSSTSGTVTGNMHGPDGFSGGRHRFAPSYEFIDASGTRRLGQCDVFGPDERIIGSQVRVLYNPQRPSFSMLPDMPAARGRLVTGLIMVAFGAAGTGMFLAVLPSP